MNETDEWDFPEVELTDAERTWLEAVYRRFRKGEKVVPRILEYELRDELPSDFKPKQIDRRLLTGKTDPTLLGVWHVNPDSKIIDLVDRLLRLLQEKAQTQVEVEDIDLRELADEWDVSLRDLSSASEVMPPGYTSGASGSPETGEDERTLWRSIRVSRDEVLNRLARYPGLEEWAQEYFESRDPEGQPIRPPPDSAFPGVGPERTDEDADLEDVADEVGLNLFGLITIPSLGSFIRKFRRWKNQDDDQ